jgi:hypothetical protein
MANFAGSGAPICRCLRSKNYYVLGRSYLEHQEGSSTAQFWCSKTQTTLGPDDSYVAPDTCRRDRPCFEPES